MDLEWKYLDTNTLEMFRKRLSTGWLLADMDSDFLVSTGCSGIQRRLEVSALPLVEHRAQYVESEL
jgi:hypothetical protein